jgi:DNA-binding NtrC family response regulator
MNPTLLIIDDDMDFRSDLVILLENDFECVQVSNSKDGLLYLKSNNPDIVLLDLMLNDGTNGLEILQKIKEGSSDLPVIMITDYASVDTAVEALKLGAEDYISKTPNLDELKLIIKRSMKERLLRLRTKYVEGDIKKEFLDIIGNSESVKLLKEQIKRLCDNQNTVLITGESGVGKELVARQFHYQSKFSDKPFISINCAAIPKDLIESELFGHEKGAFTGATENRFGKFEVADGGTLFLDEISELDLQAQVKLLRILQFKEFQRVGSNKTIRTSVRVIAATNRNLESLVKDGKFREDLFYRLNVLPINVPPLRERLSDINILANHFLIKAAIDLKIKPKNLSKEVIDNFMNYNWPGNIRELQNYITRASLITRGNEITMADVEFKLSREESLIKNTGFKVPESWNEMDKLRKEEATKASRKVEKVYLENLLKKFDGNISKAAEHAGINRTNLHKMISKCGL